MGYRVYRGWLLALLVAGCGDGQDNPSAEESETTAVPVEIAAPIRGDIVATYTGTAPIEAFADASVVAKVGGEVRRVLVEEGDDVKAGQLLAVLDGDRLRLEAAATEANLRKLERDYQRNIDLKDKSLISDGDFEKILYEMEALSASHDMARLELSYTEIRAPIDGVVSERLIKVGNTLDVNTPAFQVTSLEPLVSYLHVPEREYRRLKANQTATFEIDALPGLSFEGTVARISPTVDPQTGTFKLTLEVSDPTRRLKPGMFARIGIVSDRKADALQIPRAAVIGDAEVTSVFVVDEDRAELREIETGYADSGLVEVLSGLDDKENVVVVGQTALKDGAIVSVIPQQSAPQVTADESNTS
ncbi:MAG: efflux RND transporter periplasmic adaptor subunit [Pseudomonadota bacterium]